MVRPGVEGSEVAGSAEGGGQVEPELLKQGAVLFFYRVGKVDKHARGVGPRGELVDALGDLRGAHDGDGGRLPGAPLEGAGRGVEGILGVHRGGEACECAQNSESACGSRRGGNEIHIMGSDVCVRRQETP